jgi:hypothetical protein
MKIKRKIKIYLTSLYILMLLLHNYTLFVVLVTYQIYTIYNQAIHILIQRVILQRIDFVLSNEKRHVRNIYFQSMYFDN